MKTDNWGGGALLKLTEFLSEALFRGLGGGHSDFVQISGSHIFFHTGAHT